MHFPEEISFVPYTPAALPPSPWLVLAPHPDDEAIGMGGSILLATAKHFEVFVVFVTSGELGGEAERRKKEAEKAAAFAGIKEIFFWDLGDRQVSRKKELFLRHFFSLYRKLTPKTIFTPSLLEFHPDHRATTLWVFEGWQREKYEAALYLYEISRHSEVNCLIDISAVIEKKKEFISCYQSQLAQLPYLEIGIALNRSRAFPLTPQGVTHAEGFLGDSVGRIKKELKRRLKDYFSPFSLWWKVCLSVLV